MSKPIGPPVMCDAGIYMLDNGLKISITTVTFMVSSYLLKGLLTPYDAEIW